MTKAKHNFDANYKLHICALVRKQGLVTICQPKLDCETLSYKFKHRNTITIRFPSPISNKRDQITLHLT